MKEEIRDNGLKEGLYHLLLTKRIRALMAKQNLQGRAEFQFCDETELADMVAREVAVDIKHYLEEKFSTEDDVRKIIQQYFESETFKDTLVGDVPEDRQVLTEIKRTNQASARMRPDTEIDEAAIFVPDGISPQLGTQIAKELLSSDKAERLVSFIKLKAIRAFYPVLKDFCATPAKDGGPRLKIATTTYMGASDAKALELLFDLPNLEVRMSYDNDDTRLHAKAYLFYRDTGFSTAYIGSANLSDQAMTTGLEWTVKFSQATMPQLWERAKSSFLKSWENHQVFEPCSRKDYDRIKRALDLARMKVSGKSPSNQFLLPDYELQPRPYQSVVIDAIEREKENGKFRHLVIAATGTGKTMVAAFDFAKAFHQFRQKRSREPSFLYIVHRKDILGQAREKYRMVLRDKEFGIILGQDEYDSTKLRAIFTTPQSWASTIKDVLPKDAFDFIVMDECHHAAAKTYDTLLDYYKDVIDSGKSDLLGLTATPDREDGKDIRCYFGGAFTHELSLANAITCGYLVPFSYFGILDDKSVSFDDIDWTKRKEAERAVQSLLENNHVRAENVLREAEKYVPNVNEMRGLGFCAGIKHAQLMVDTFNGKGIKAVCLQGKSTIEERESAIRSLQSEDESRIRIIFTADLFNEGVDIPNVDTVMMLRPTDSATIFTQQLGRGLRKPTYGYKKDSLLVLDFVSQQNDKFDGAVRFNVLTARHDIPIGRQVEKGMPFLPAGCSVTLEQQARNVILKNINAHLARLRGQRFINEITKTIREAGRRLPLQEIMGRFQLDSPRKLFSQGETPTELYYEAIEGRQHDGKDSRANFMLRVMENDDPTLLDKWNTELKKPFRASATREEKEFRFSLATCQDYQHVRVSTVDEVWKQICEDSGLKQDFQEYYEWCRQKILPREVITFKQSGSLNLHNRYSRTQIMASFGSDGSVPMTGVSIFQDRKAVAFFVTRHKSEKDFSPTTMYKDYAITLDRFKWDSQNTTTADSRQGRMYIKGEGEYTPMLFVQDHKKAEGGIPESFVFLGPLEYESHEGECPISFVWKLRYPMPPEVFEWAQ